MTHPAALPPEKILAECRETHTRRSGPGGQHRNKVKTAVVLEHSPSGIRAEASERRSQQQNRERALQRLRLKLALALRAEQAAEPSDLWKQRTSGGRISVSTEHTDYPALLAEAMDGVHAHDFDVAATSQSLGVSSSQLIKFLKTEPAALKQVNDSREALGLGQLL